MKRIFALGAFLLLAAAQLAIPVTMILRQENILRHGKVYKFEAEPVDPVDVFKGRYVALRFKDVFVRKPSDFEVIGHQEVFALLQTDPQGFSRVVSLTRQRPRSDDFIRVSVRSYDWRNERVYLDFPFRRYYMDENLAPLAENAYRDASRGKPEEAYVTVRVLNGSAVLEELYLKGRPVRELVLEELQKKVKVQNDAY
jgi:uncharacterized membrane-anchored protein